MRRYSKQIPWEVVSRKNITYRRPRNLKDILVHSDFLRPKPRQSGMFVCRRHCTSCQKIMTGTTFTSHTNNRKFKIEGHHNCQSNYVIYLIECNLCHQQYVGQTSNTLHARLTSHSSDIKKRKLTSVAAHFTSPGHSITHLKCTAIAQSYRDGNLKLRHEEAWIRLLETWYPNGMNIKE